VRSVLLAYFSETLRLHTPDSWSPWLQPDTFCEAIDQDYFNNCTSNSKTGGKFWSSFKCMTESGVYRNCFQEAKLWVQLNVKAVSDDHHRWKYFFFKSKYSIFKESKILRRSKYL